MDRVAVTQIDTGKIGEDIGLLTSMRTTRAIRRLKSDPVPEALLHEVCELGTYAPSGGNRQRWYFVAVMDVSRR